MPVDPQNPVKTPYDQRIQHLQNRIQHKPGSNDRLRNRLTRLKVKQFGQIQNTPTPIPWDAASQTAYDNATRDYNTTTAGINAQQQETNREYYDPSNPYSKAAMLQQAYTRNLNNTGNTYAAQGQLYSGSTQNALNYDRSSMLQGSDALRNAYAAANQGYTQANLQAQTAETDAQHAAYVQALQDALNTRPDGAPGLPGFVKRYYKQKIAKAEKHHQSGKADKYRKRLQNAKNPNPVTVAPKP